MLKQMLFYLKVIYSVGVFIKLAKFCNKVKTIK